MPVALETIIWVPVSLIGNAGCSRRPAISGGRLIEWHTKIEQTQSVFPPASKGGIGGGITIQHLSDSHDIILWR